jgi:hypothetical protein
VGCPEAASKVFRKRSFLGKYIKLVVGLPTGLLGAFMVHFDQSQRKTIILLGATAVLTLYRSSLLLRSTIMASIDSVVPQPPTSPRPPQTPPSSPALPACEQVLTLKHMRQFLELLRTVQTVQPVGESVQPVETKEECEDKPKLVARASKLEFKTVSEVLVS